jgi:acetamidase/formamidase
VKGTRGVGILSVCRRQGGELDTEGAGRGHAVHMGVPARGAYVHLGS